MVVDLNQTIPFGEKNAKRMFDKPVKVCRQTNVVFSAYDDQGMNHVKVAFLGVFDRRPEGEADGAEDEFYRMHSEFKVSSCDAKTRYEYDSQSTTDLALTKGRYFDKTDGKWVEPGNDDWNADISDPEDRVYIDDHVAPNPTPTEDKPWESKFNSYDSNDKYVLVLDIVPSIDSDVLFNMSWDTGMTGHVYNILSDAGCIPHFAYQSLVRYSDKDGGTAYTWRNKFLKGKNHL